MNINHRCRKNVDDSKAVVKCRHHSSQLSRPTVELCGSSWINGRCQLRETVDPSAAMPVPQQHSLVCIQITAQVTESILTNNKTMLDNQANHFVCENDIPLVFGYTIGEDRRPHRPRRWWVFSFYWKVRACELPYKLNSWPWIKRTYLCLRQVDRVIHTWTRTLLSWVNNGRSLFCLSSFFSFPRLWLYSCPI